MIKAGLLIVFFLTLALDEMLNVGLVITAGLSAKNAFLYVLLIVILCSKVIEGRQTGIQFPAIHLLFILLIGNALLSIFVMHFVTGETAGYTLLRHVATLKSDLVDMYLLFLVFFYGLETRQGALAFSKIFLVLISLMTMLTLMDVLGMPSLGLTSFRGARLEGPLGAANAYGIFLSFFIPVLAAATFGMRNLLLKCIYFLGATISFAFLIHTGSRGGLVGVVGGLILAGWWLRGGYDVRRVIMTVAALLAVAVAVLVTALVVSEDVSIVVEQRLERSTEGSIDDASSGRLGIWGSALAYQMERPWTLLVGAGWWTFWNRVGMGPHSAYMNYFFSLGLIGLGLFLALLYQIISEGRRGFLSGDALREERLMLAALVLGWSALIVAMITGSIFKPWMFVWPFTACCLRIAYELLQEEAGKAPVRYKTSSIPRQAGLGGAGA